MYVSVYVHCGDACVVWLYLLREIYCVRWCDTCPCSFVRVFLHRMRYLLRPPLAFPLPPFRALKRLLRPSSWPHRRRATSSRSLCPPPSAVFCSFIALRRSSSTLSLRVSCSFLTFITFFPFGRMAVDVICICIRSPATLSAIASQTHRRLLSHQSLCLFLYSSLLCLSDSAPLYLLPVKFSLAASCLLFS